eukprot:10459942-Lingulodinium_polyedra.AAC.1
MDVQVVSFVLRRERNGISSVPVFFTIGLRARSCGYRFRGQRRLFEPGPFGPSKAFMPRRASECVRAG